jgi:DNA-directed RNA polymerase sigma subunit (sigma70/sigma32)
LLKNLKERDREIMIKLYGLNGVPQMQIRDVAKDYNLTAEMVRQINIKSLKKLRKFYSL